MKPRHRVLTLLALALSLIAAVAVAIDRARPSTEGVGAVPIVATSEARQTASPAPLSAVADPVERTESVIEHGPRSGSALRVRVVERASRAPLAQARIAWIEGEPCGCAADRGLPEIAASDAITADDGRAAIAIPRAGRFTCVVEAHGYLRRVVGTFDPILAASAAEHEIEVLLEREHRLHGIVLDSDGAPIDGATVTARVDARELAWAAFANWSSATRTDPGGRFEIASAPGAPLIVDAAVAGRPSALVEIDGSIEPTPSIEIVLRRGATVEGRVSREHESVADAWVTLGHGATGDARLARTDSEGVFRFEHVPAGSCDLAVRIERGDDAPLESIGCRVATSDGETHKVELRLPCAQLGRIRGTLDTGDAPIAAAWIELRARPDHETLLPPPRRIQVEPGSTFEFDEVPAGAYELLAMRVDTAGAVQADIEAVDVAAGGTVIARLALGTASIRVRLLAAADDAPVPGAACALERQVGDAWRVVRMAADGAATADAAGELVHERLRDGDYRLRWIDDAGETAVVSDVLTIRGGRGASVVLRAPALARAQLEPR